MNVQRHRVVVVVVVVVIVVTIIVVVVASYFYSCLDLTCVCLQVWAGSL